MIKKKFYKTSNYKKEGNERKMYIFNKITVNPQLPKRIEKIGEISNNLWWSWNTEYLKLFKKIDIDLWDNSDKNPVKFLKHVSQKKLEDAAQDEDFLKEYDSIVSDGDKISKIFQTFL